MTDDIDHLQQRLNDLKKDITPIESLKEHKAPPKNDANKGYELLGTPIICGGLGMGLDKLFSTSPVFFLSLAILGLMAGFWSLFKAERNIVTPIDSKRLQVDKKKANKTAISEKISDN